MSHAPLDTRRKSDLDPHRNVPGQKNMIMPTKTRLGHVYQSLIFQYAALGSTPLEIAKALHLPKKQIFQALNEPHAANEIRKLVESGPISSAKNFIHKNFLKGIMKLSHLMDNAENQDVQRKAAQGLVELAINKSGASLFDNKQDIEKLSREQVIEQLREEVAKSRNASGN